MDEKFKDGFDRVAELRAKLCSECETCDELVMVASLLMNEACHIYVELGGKKLAAAQCYGVADRLAGEIKAD